MTKSSQTYHVLEIKRKAMILYTTTIIGIVLALSLGSLAWYEGYSLLGTVDLFVAVFLIGTTFYIKLTQNYTLACQIGIPFTGFFFMYLFATGGVNNTAGLWYYTFPLFSCFLIGSRRGLAASLVLFLFAIAVYFTSSTIPFFASYDADFMLRFVPSFLAVTLFAYFYEVMREQHLQALLTRQEELEQEIAAQTSELEETNETLANEIEERTKIAHDLQKEKDQTRNLLDMAPVIFVVLDLHHRIVFINKQGCDILGYDQSAIVGKDWFKHFVPGKCTENATRAFAGIIAGDLESFQYYENQVLTQNGQERLIAWNNSCVQDEQGTIIRVISAGEDITRRRLEEHKIAELNNIFAQLGPNPEENIRFIVEQTGMLLQGAASLYNRLDDRGKSLCVWAGTNLPEDMPKIDTPAGHICYEATIKGKDQVVVLNELQGTVYEKTDRNVRQYGLRSYLGFPITLKENPIGSLCIVDTRPRNFSDTEVQIITTLAKAISLEEERKLAEEKQQEAHSRLLTVLNSIESIIYVADMNTYEIIFANKHAKELFGEIERTICWQTLQEGQTGPCDFCTNRYLLDEEGNPANIFTYEFKNTRTGKWLYIKDRAIPWIDGRIVRLEIATDITPLKDTNLELEKRVNERTEELKKAHQQLLHAEKLTAIGNLSASVAHEFNNPLQGILSVIKGIKRRVRIAPEDEKLVDMAIKECLRMTTLIKSMQDFNRPTPGRVALMDLHAAIDSVLLLCRREFESKNITLQNIYGKNIPRIKAVADQMKQVFLNLLYNAADACEEGGIVSIETSMDEGFVVIAIKDSGKGIKEDILPHIFEPFFTTKSEVKGTGLGLSVSYGIIKRHGGRIDVTSKPGEGSIFSITLPIRGIADA